LADSAEGSGCASAAGDADGVPTGEGTGAGMGVEDGVGADCGVAEGSDDGCRFSVGRCDGSVDCAIARHGKRQNVKQRVGKSFCIEIKRMGIKIVRCTNWLRSNFSRGELVHVTPYPRLAGLNGADERMLGAVKMLGRVLVLRRIAAADVAAR